MMLTSINKEKNLLVFGFDNDKTAIYDFKERKAIGVRGKEIFIDSFLKYTENVTSEVSNEIAYKLIIGTKELRYKASYVILLARLEQWFSYIDLLDREALTDRGWYAGNYIDELNYVKMDKGYIKWLRANDYKISFETFKDYEIYKASLAMVGNKEENEKLIKLICKYFNFGDDFLKLTASMQKKLIKSLKIDFKNYNLPTKHYDLHQLLINYPTLEQYYDDNRGFDYNTEQLMQIKDAEREKAILAQEEKIFDLEKLDLDDLQIIVPHTLEDFIDEGTQQHNCVGSYYHNSIVRGENLIYFVRKKNNPDKSYITCRYSIIDKTSVETREVDNTSVKDVSPTLFPTIDREITRLLEIANN